MSDVEEEKKTTTKVTKGTTGHKGYEYNFLSLRNYPWYRRIEAVLFLIGGKTCLPQVRGEIFINIRTGLFPAVLM
jgi:hypothetical protein